MAWDLGGAGEAEDVRAGADRVGVEAVVVGALLDEAAVGGVVGVERGVGVVVHVPVVEQEAGPWCGEDEGTECGVERVGEEGGLCVGALVGAEQVEVEARAGCLE